MKTKSKELTPIAIDLFSGCGGLTLGLKRAGFRVIGAIEIDPLSAETYRTNHQEVNLWEKDIRDVGVKDLKRQLEIRKGQLDLLAGCPPCQGFSSMRTLNRPGNVADPRNDLILEFLHLVRELRPKTVMMENVPGFAADERFIYFREGLVALGYSVVWDVLNAADYGIPQRRRRLILLASRVGTPSFAPADCFHVTVQDAIGGLPAAGQSGDPLHDFPTKHTDPVLKRISMTPKDGGSRRALGEEFQLDCHRRHSSGFNDVYGRMWWNAVSPTITTGCFNPSKGRFLHPTEDRGITLREASLLQGFPPDYYFSLARGKSPAGAMIGNALPPEFVRRHAKILKECINKKRSPSP